MLLVTLFCILIFIVSVIEEKSKDKFIVDIIKIIGIAFITVIFTIILKEYKKDFAIYAVIIGGSLILFYSMETISSIINFINTLSNKSNISSEFIKLLIKITSISILIEFAVSICKDCGENAIAQKLDLGGKAIVISMSIPVISTMLNGLLELLA